MKLNIKKIDWKNPKFRNILAVAILTAASISLWYYKIYEPTNQQLRSLKSEQEKKKGELNAILVLKSQLNTLKEDVRRNEIKLDSLKSIFPDQKEIPKLLMDITAIARASNIQTTKFDPLPDIVFEYYIQNRYLLNVNGSYHSLANFFSFLANLPLIINLSKVVIRPNPTLLEQIKLNQEYGTEIQSISASFEMTTFSSKK